MKSYRIASTALTVVLLLVGVVPAFAADGRFVTKWGSLGTGNNNFNRVCDVSIGPSGDVFALDTNNNRVVRHTSAGVYVSQFSIGGAAGAYGLYVDSTGNVFVADTSTSSVRKYNPAGAIQLTIAGITDARDVITDGSGNIYITSYSGNYVRKYNSGGTLLATWSVVQGPRGIAITPSGDLYIAEHVPGTLNRITQLSSVDGSVIRRWGSTGTGDGQMSGDIGIGVGPDGSVYVGEYLNNRIQKFTATGAYLTKWGGPGTGNGQFNGVRGVAVDSSDILYAADTDNHRVQAFGNYDTVPPVITVNGVAEGESYAGPVTVVFSATDAVEGTVPATATLNGDPFTSGSTISAPGSYTLVTTATDGSANTSTVTVHFSIATPPVVSSSASSWWSLALVGVLGIGVLGVRRRSRA